MSLTIMPIVIGPKDRKNGSVIRFFAVFPGAVV
jgi:hypothetical protein